MKFKLKTAEIELLYVMLLNIARTNEKNKEIAKKLRALAKKIEPPRNEIDLKKEEIAGVVKFLDLILELLEIAEKQSKKTDKLATIQERKEAINSIKKVINVSA